MPVAPEELDAITSVVVDLFRQAEAALVALLKHWITADEFDPELNGPAWAEKKLASVRPLLQAAQAVQDGVADKTNTAVITAASTAFKAGAASPAKTLLAALGPDHPLTAAAKTALKETPNWGGIEALANAVINDIGQKQQNVLRDVEDIYRAVITAAAGRTIIGAQARRQASQSAYAALLDRGVTNFVDRAGRKWQLSSYVEMAVRTVSQRAAVQGEEDRLRSLGINLVSVSNVAQECERCEPFEGRILSLDGPTGAVTVAHQLTDAPLLVHVVATVSEARLLGLFHPNCRHTLSGYLPGVSKLPPQPTADPGGRKARERQRALERAIRRAKTKQLGALTPEAEKAYGRKIRERQKQLREHLKQHPKLKRLTYREQIGAGNIPPASVNDPVDPIWPPEPPPPPALPPFDLPEPGPDAGPDPFPEFALPDPLPAPEPGDEVLAELLDPNNDLTEQDLIDLLTGDTEHWAGAESGLEDAAAALKRFNELAHAGEHDTAFAKGHKTFVKKLGSTPDEKLDSYVKRRLGQLKTLEQRAATLAAWWREQARRAAERERANARPRPPGMRHGHRWRQNHEAVTWAMGEMPMPETSQYQLDALKAYTGSSYTFINNALRGWVLPEGASAQLRFDRYVEHLDALFAKTSLPESLIVHRGVGRSITKAWGEGISVDDPASMRSIIGKVYDEPGYISTSVGARAKFDGDVYFMFRLPQGYQALNAMHHSVYGTGEREVLIRRDARYLVHDVYQRPGSNTWWVEAEMVPDDWEPDADWTPDPYGDAHEGYS